MLGNTSADTERRRSPRFSCGGYANISCLPSDGIVLRGTIRDVSLGGCHVDTALRIDCGARAEILVRVNAASFRALGEVKAVRGNSGVGLEFVQLSAGGKDMLSELVTDLARLEAVVNKLKGMRREIDAESFREELQQARLQAMLLGNGLPLFRATVRAENSQKNDLESSDSNRVVEVGSDVQQQPLVVTVDLFG